MFAVGFFFNLAAVVMTGSLVGNLLIASTLVKDSIFCRAVCLVVHHDDSGAIGVMLNRPIVPPPAELLDMLVGLANSDAESDSPANALPAAEKPSAAGKSNRLPPQDDAAISQGSTSGPLHAPGSELAGDGGSRGMVHFGGPLSGPVVAVHDSLDLAEVEAGRGVYVAAQKEHLERLVREYPGDFRLIIGHAAWTGDQLGAEFDAGFWHVLPATPETVFPMQDDLWPYLLRRATGASVAAWIGANDTKGGVWLN